MSNLQDAGPSGTKRGRKTIVSKAPLSNRFLNRINSEAYVLFSNAKITESKVIIDNRLDFPILELFRETSLFFLVTLQFAYNPEMLFEFLANFRLDLENNIMKSYVCQKHVEFSEADLCRFLRLSGTGPRAHEVVSNSGFRWDEVNRTLRGKGGIYHDPITETLNTEAKVVQHVLRNAVLPKAGDMKNITPLLSLVTYFVRSNENFNSANLILRYFESLQIIGNPETKKKYNISLGHVVAFLLSKKYQLVYPEEATHSSTPFTNHSFHIFYSLEKSQRQQQHIEEEEDQEVQEEAASSSSWDARFDRLETQLAEQNQAWHNAITELRAEQNQHFDQLSMQMGQLFSFFQPPPPPPPSDDGDYV